MQLTIIKEVRKWAVGAGKWDWGISIYNFFRSNKLGRRKCTTSWHVLASFCPLPFSQFVNYCKMNFFTDDHAGKEILVLVLVLVILLLQLRLWLGQQQLPFPGLSGTAWNGCLRRQCFQHQDFSWSFVRGLITFDVAIVVAGWRDVPSADIPSSLALFHSKLLVSIPLVALKTTLKD